MVANPEKCKIIFLGSLKNNNNIPFIVENEHMKSTNEGKPLGITIDQKLTFYKTQTIYTIQHVIVLELLQEK